ncbi:MAG: hypothetical protein HYX74_07655 [Acidobacteria bacterium]|nr:hypothetical protein [Acidobacteriota bacterium]
MNVLKFVFPDTWVAMSISTRIQKFNSFEEQRRSEIEYYYSLCPKDRLRIFRRLQTIAYGPEKKWPRLRHNPVFRLRPLSS